MGGGGLLRSLCFVARWLKHAEQQPAHKRAIGRHAVGVGLYGAGARSTANILPVKKAANSTNKHTCN